MPKTIFEGDHQRLVEALIEVRREAGLTQAQLAMILGKDQKFVSLVERGQRRVDVIEFITLARAMGQEPAHLFERVLAKIGRG